MMSPAMILGDPVVRGGPGYVLDVGERHVGVRRCGWWTRHLLVAESRADGVVGDVPKHAADHGAVGRHRVIKPRTGLGAAGADLRWRRRYESR